jgi:acyl-coenzyme A synthetase/AMP-(fatty) acid ligase
MLQALSAIPDAAEGDYSSLRNIAYGASPITEEAMLHAIRTFHCDLIQVYGLTENDGCDPRSCRPRTAIPPARGRDCSEQPAGPRWISQPRCHAIPRASS